MIALTDKVRASMAGAPTDILLTALLALDSRECDEMERQARSWLCDFLEERHPVLTVALEAWAADPDHPMSYCEVIASVLRREGIVKP